MKGATLTELNKSYRLQARFIAGRYIHANVKYFRDKTDSIFFELELAADKHRREARRIRESMILKTPLEWRNFKRYN